MTQVQNKFQLDKGITSLHKSTVLSIHQPNYAKLELKNEESYAVTNKQKVFPTIKSGSQAKLTFVTGKSMLIILIDSSKKFINPLGFKNIYSNPTAESTSNKMSKKDL
jgi:hypothetical protein